MSLTLPASDGERFLLACLVLGVTADYDYEGTDMYRLPEQPKNPYQGNEGQRPGESFTAYRIRMRKDRLK